MDNSVTKIIQLTGDQIADYWEYIKQVVYSSRGSHKEVENVLAALLSDEMQCWAACRDLGEQTKIAGFLITEIREDPYSEVRQVLIRYLLSYEKLSWEDWVSGFAGLALYGRSKGCCAITSYTTNMHLLEMSKKLPSQVCAFIAFPL